MAMTERTDESDVPLLSKEEAIAEVRRWLEVEQVDPERVFAGSAEGTIRYKDLIDHIQRETPDGKLLLFAISRGRLIKEERQQMMADFLQIAPPPPPKRSPSG
jgi:hypothetical protein